MARMTNEDPGVTQPLLIERRDGVDRVTLNRPDHLNALDPSLIEALNGYFAGLQRDRGTRVVVLRGAGSAFCAGLDLKELAAGGNGLTVNATNAVIKGLSIDRFANGAGIILSGCA